MGNPCIDLRGEERELHSAKSISNDMGTIIVTYQTDEKGNKLDRIRFWLINENDEKTLYPKREEFISSSHTCEERTVVIPHLPQGKYRIEFILPLSVHIIEEIPSIEVALAERSIVKIDQVINISPLPKEKYSSEIAYLPIKRSPPFSLFPHLGVIYTNYMRPWNTPPPLPYKYAHLTVISNLPTKWRIMKDQYVVYTGYGSIQDTLLRPGYRYHVVGDPVPGYTLSSSPQNYFDVFPEDFIKIELFYQKDAGYLQLDMGPVSPTESVKLTISFLPAMHERPPLKVLLQPDNGTIAWRSGPLEAGPYAITYTFDSLPPITQNIFLRKDQTYYLSPPIGSRPSFEPSTSFQNSSPSLSNEPGQIHVKANIPQAIYSLMDDKGEKIAVSQGVSYTFKALKPGYYTLVFSSSDSELYVPPLPTTILVDSNATSEADALYKIKGKMLIRGNVDHFGVKIVSQDNPTITFKEEIVNRSKVIQLPEGDYSIIPEMLPDMPRDSVLPSTISVTIKSTLPQTVFLNFGTNKRDGKSSVEGSSKGISLSSNLSDFNFTMRIPGTTKEPVRMNAKGKTTSFIPSAEGNEIELSFEHIPNYRTPDPMVIPVDVKKPIVIQANYIPEDAFLYVPAGMVIVGDPFSDNKQNEQPSYQVDVAAFQIATYPVTNTQFSDWLNEKVKKKTIKIDPKKPGFVVDNQGVLIVKTMEEDPLSQISFSNQNFAPLPGKENHPVILVTWEGAYFYCKDKGYRLPTESEWEKAAGMAPTIKGEPLKKYKYGFSENTIDRSWANYRDETKPIQTPRVATTPVGFYNGSHSLSLTEQDREQIKTHDAMSPVGAYDMSGNVWEWIASPASIQQEGHLVKGGCYDSLAEGVRVSERLLLPQKYADVFTGFRPAKDTVNH